MNVYQGRSGTIIDFRAMVATLFERRHFKIIFTIVETKMIEIIRNWWNLDGASFDNK